MAAYANNDHSYEVKEPCVNNVKIHFSVNECALPILLKGIELNAQSSGDSVGKRNKRNFKKYHNFIVFRNSYVFIIFTRGTVNITGIKRFEDIQDAVTNFCQTFQLTRDQISDYVIDNVSANGDFGKRLDLIQLKNKINSEEGEKIIASSSYNTDYFPAAFCKSYSIGTVLLFFSGKFNIVGAKSQEDVSRIYREICVYTNEH